MKFWYLGVVAWMALTTYAAEESFCTEECPSYSISGIALPVDGIEHRFSVWQKENNSIYFNGRRTNTLGRMWYNITTISRDGKLCIASPGLLKEPEYCNATDSFFEIVVYGLKALWTFDCNRDSCGCPYQQLIAVRIDMEVASKVFWWPQQNISKIVIAKNLTEQGRVFPVQSLPKWHDIAMRSKTTGSGYVLMSSSLNVSYDSISQHIWIYGINDKGEKLQSYFALGLETEPTENPVEKPVQGIIGWYPALGLLLILVVAVVIIIMCRSRRRRQETDLALQSESHNMVPLEHPPPELEDRTSEDDHEYSYIDTEALRIQLERERAEELGPGDPMRDSGNRRSTDDYEYCYIDAESLRNPLEEGRAEGLTTQDLVDRRSTDDHEYSYIDAEALRIQLEKEKRERLESQSKRKMSTTSHDSKNSFPGILGQK